jgi:hypothetical protein
MIERLDINDAKEWSEMDIADLKNHVAQGASLAETSEFLCRSDTFEVARRSLAPPPRGTLTSFFRRPIPCAESALSGEKRLAANEFAPSAILGTQSWP